MMMPGCVRWACAETLGNLGDSGITPHLIRMMRDSHGYGVPGRRRGVGENR